jgi:hypothetical protein
VRYLIDADDPYRSRRSRSRSSRPECFVLNINFSCRRQKDFIRKKFAEVNSGIMHPTVLVLYQPNPSLFREVFSFACEFLADEAKDRGFFKFIGVANASCCLPGPDGLAPGDAPAGRADSAAPAVHYLERWNRNSIANCLESRGIAVDVTNRLLESTGGWDCLLVPEFASLAVRDAVSSDPALPRLKSDLDRFRPLAGFPDPPRLYRLIDIVLLEFNESAYTLKSFLELLELTLDYLKESPEPWLKGMKFDPGAATRAFYLLQRLTVVLPCLPGEIVPGHETESTSFRTDRHYLAALEREAVPGEPSGPAAPPVDAVPAGTSEEAVPAGTAELTMEGGGQ